jgi:hypothetical protein
LIRLPYRIALTGLAFSVCVSATAAAGRSSAAASPVAAFDPSLWHDAEIGRLRPDVFEMALGAASCAIQSGDVSKATTLTVIDFSRPSTEKRLWVFDLSTRALLYEELVAHGQGSGDNTATRFSNDPESHRSSLGLFKIDDSYIGKNGYSLRLDGLEAGFNDRARERAIVVHGAAYVSSLVAQKQGRLGRSWGCPALSESVVREIIDRVKGSGLMFAYYPDRAWLQQSRYLGSCGRSSSASTS